ncbi:hypothetical protein HY639_01360 [Candidatus Woesearchaeota archaeon]|nr:hypothetical protein [Candidatus Woesearchaeota archaeon]
MTKQITFIDDIAYDTELIPYERAHDVARYEKYLDDAEKIVKQYKTSWALIWDDDGPGYGAQGKYSSGLMLGGCTTLGILYSLAAVPFTPLAMMSFMVLALALRAGSIYLGQKLGRATALWELQNDYETGIRELNRHYLEEKKHG